MNITSTSGSVADILCDLSKSILNGATIDEALNQIYDSFRQWLPYDRIGFAEIDNVSQVARAIWHRSNDRVLLRKNYAAPLAGSSLSIVVARRQPRILNDLPTYLEHRPESRSTALIVREGIKSSMTCPLFVKDKPMGLLFFSSRELDTYCENHVEIMREIATQLAMLLMASQHTVSREVVRPIEAVPVSPKASNKLQVSQLKPGMVLDAPIMAGGKLLLASGTELSEQSISRLGLLRGKEMLDIPHVQVDRNYVC